MTVLLFLAMQELTAPVRFDAPEADRILEKLQILPPDHPINADVSSWPLHPDSAKIVASVGLDKPLRYNTDMGFVLVPSGQKKVDVKITAFPDESDPGPYPVPDDVPLEGWPAYYRRNVPDPRPTLEEVQRDASKWSGDRHAIVLDPAGMKLYEFFVMRRTDAGWEADCAAIFDLTTTKLRPEGWTSADAAGLPILPCVVRHDEIARGEIRHALRVTVRKTRRAYVAPATHYASRHHDPELPRMGERFRLRKDFDTSTFTRPVRVILEALKKHGMLVADNGIEWAVSVTPDERIPVLHEELRKVRGRDFEVVVAPVTR